MRSGHYDLSMASDMWLGFQFRTIDPRRLRIIDFKPAEKAPVVTPPSTGSEDNK